MSTGRDRGQVDGSCAVSISDGSSDGSGSRFGPVFKARHLKESLSVDAADDGIGPADASLLAGVLPADAALVADGAAFKAAVWAAMLSTLFSHGLKATASRQRQF
jgi:hypothetical protein